MKYVNLSDLKKRKIDWGKIMSFTVTEYLMTIKEPIFFDKDSTEYLNDWLKRMFGFTYKQMKKESEKAKYEMREFLINDLKKYKVSGKEFNRFLFDNYSNKATRIVDRVKLVTEIGDVSDIQFVSKDEQKIVIDTFKKVTEDTLLELLDFPVDKEERYKKIASYLVLHYSWNEEFNRIPPILRFILGKKTFKGLSVDEKRKVFQQLTENQKESILKVKKFNIKQIRNLYYLLSDEEAKKLENEYESKFNKK